MLLMLLIIIFKIFLSNNIFGSLKNILIFIRF